MTVSCKALCHPRGDKCEVGMSDLPPVAVFLGMCWTLGGEMGAGHRDCCDGGSVCAGVSTCAHTQ